MELLLLPFSTVENPWKWLMNCPNNHDGQCLYFLCPHKRELRETDWNRIKYSFIVACNDTCIKQGLLPVYTILNILFTFGLFYSYLLLISELYGRFVFRPSSALLDLIEGSFRNSLKATGTKQAPEACGNEQRP